MNKTLMIVIIIALLGLVVASLTYLNSSRTQSLQETQIGSVEQDTSTVDKPDTGSLKATFTDLLKLGKNYQCTYDYTDESQNHLYGKVYIAESGDKMYGDFVMVSLEGTQVQSNVIRDGDYMYIWSSDSEQGLKTKVSLDDESLLGDIDTTTSDDSTTTPPTDLAMDFDCDNWIVNSSMFVPPSNIEFVDFSAQLQQMMEDSDSESLKCAACDQLTGDSKTQCLAALGCN